MKPQVSVIIPVKDDTVRLLNCLKALEDQTFAHDTFEILVIDNNSNPPVPENITGSNKITIKLFRELRPSGFCARNKGIENAFGYFLAFTDADTTPHSDWLKHGIECFKANTDASFVGGKVEIAMSEDPDAVEFFEYFYAFDQEKYIRKNNFAVTANMFTTREMIIKNGGFNNKLQSGGDREWGERASKFGNGVYCEDSLVYHPARKNWDELKIKIERTIKGYFEINFSENKNKYELLPEIIGDMFPVKQFFDLMFVKKAPFMWKIKAFYILIKLKWYRSYLKLKFMFGMKI